MMRARSGINAPGKSSSDIISLFCIYDDPSITTEGIVSQLKYCVLDFYDWQSLFDSLQQLDSPRVDAIPSLWNRYRPIFESLDFD